MTRRWGWVRTWYGRPDAMFQMFMVWKEQFSRPDDEFPGIDTASVHCPNEHCKCTHPESMPTWLAPAYSFTLLPEEVA